MFYFYETQTKDQTLKEIGDRNSAGNMRIFIIVFFFLSTSQDINEISALLLKNNFTISDPAAQEKANKTCCYTFALRQKIA
jgi:hypothetical protein